MTDPQRPSDPTPSGDLELAPGVSVPSNAVELTYTGSSGPGGQNVNKRSTRCQLRIAMDDLPLRASHARRLEKLAGSRLTGSGELIISSDEHRTQRRNREECFQRLRELLVEATRPRKRRIPTKPTRSSERKRLEEKKQRGQIKKRRGEQIDPPDG